VSGCVHLVGAGPGDPDLLTLRGAELLGRADVVVYDSLAPRELLELAPARALRIDVGKLSHDVPTRSQGDINALLVHHARQGATVVRLKGGDPFVFGRGGEEASACRAAGVAFEVVPGVSSAIAALAYAGIPVTDRRFSSGFTVVTGHKDPTPSARGLRWAELASGADTLVVLMAMRNLEEIVERLLRHGRPAATPAAVVMQGSLPAQRVVEAPLGELVVRTRAAGLVSPAALVVGDVVRLREELAWFERRPLFGRRVLVTRPAERAGALARQLREAGAEPVRLPLVAIVPLRDPGLLDEALSRLGRYDAVLFTSRSAVRIFAQRLQARDEPAGEAEPVRPRAVWCVGPASAEEARRAGLEASVPARTGFDAEAMLEALARRGVAGQRLLFPCAVGARDVLPVGLRERGARVDAVPIYETRPVEHAGDALRAELAGGRLHALTFASPSAVSAFAALLDPEARGQAKACAVVALGRATAAALARESLAPDAVAERPGAPGLVEALIRTLAERRT
jgi:uroporphyrinogen III methyltransferase/synthase